MSDCESCGRDDGHWIGCKEALLVLDRHTIRSGGIDRIWQCEHDGCSEPKKEWSGRGAKPKYCADGHK